MSNTEECVRLAQRSFSGDRFCRFDLGILDGDVDFSENNFPVGYVPRDGIDPEVLVSLSSSKVGVFTITVRQNLRAVSDFQVVKFQVDRHRASRSPLPSSKSAACPQITSGRVDITIHDCTGLVTSPPGSRKMRDESLISLGPNKSTKEKVPWSLRTILVLSSPY